MKRFFSKRDMFKATDSMEIFNSALKRGKIKKSEDILRLHHVLCGCGAEGCIFISVMRKKLDESLLK